MSDIYDEMPDGDAQREHNLKRLAELERRMDEIRLKQILGAPLTTRELMCLQIEQHGFGCGSHS